MIDQTAKQIISEEVVRSRVPKSVKKAIKADIANGKGANESVILREILCRHYGIRVPQPWGK